MIVIQSFIRKINTENKVVCFFKGKYSSQTCEKIHEFLKRKIEYAPYVLIFLLLSSCSARWHLRQAEKHLKKAELKGAQVKADTIFVKDTVVTQYVTHDTLFRSAVGDTILIEKEKLRIKYVRLAGDTVHIQGECLPDTIIREIPVTIHKEIKAPDRWYHSLPWLLLLVAIGIAIGIFIKSR
jgi:hypothetical protein